MAEFVGVKILYTVPLAEFLEKPGWALRVHRLRSPLLCKAPFRNAGFRLVLTELLQQCQGIRPHIHQAHPAILGACGVHPRRNRILQIAPHRHRTGLKVNVPPLEAAQLPTSEASISSQVNVCLPLQRLLGGTGEDIGQLLYGVRLVAFLFGLFSLARRWPLHFQHGIHGNGIIQKGHLKDPVQYVVQLHRRGVGIARPLEVHQ